MRFGLGWRRELAAGILARLDRIEVVEVLAEEHLDARRSVRRALRFLGTQVPLVLHATSLGLASTETVDRRRLDAIARLVGWLEPEFWSEHLAFVRAGTREVGHLAAPPRNEATLEGLAKNVALATRVVGAPPLLENVASLIEPPFSDYAEDAWLAAVLDRTGCDLLLDLHNLHANAVNFGFEARDVLRVLPPERIGAIHLAGGRRIERGRLLDDHRHAVPDPVYELLGEVQADRATVILERDGCYPGIDDLVLELERARASVARPRGTHPRVPPSTPARRAAPDVIPFLARLYADGKARARFLADPYGTALECGFDAAGAAVLATMNPADLALAGRSFDTRRARVNR